MEPRGTWREYIEAEIQPECHWCGGLIEYPDDTRVHAEYVLERDYCSIECRGLALSGEDHPNYKGGHINRDGYRIVSVGGDAMFEHRRVMEEHLGRSLREGEVVHHKNGDRRDNRIENLEVMDRPQHTRHHLPEMLAGRGLKYEPKH